MITTKKTGGRINRVAWSNFPTNEIFGIKLLCTVRSIAFPKSMISPGISRNTENRARKIAHIRHTAMSMPMPNFINAMAIRPPIVVSELEKISGIALLRATISASLMPRVLCSSL